MNWIMQNTKREDVGAAARGILTGWVCVRKKLTRRAMETSQPYSMSEPIMTASPSSLGSIWNVGSLVIFERRSLHDSMPQTLPPLLGEQTASDSAESSWQ